MKSFRTVLIPFIALAALPLHLSAQEPGREIMEQVENRPEARDERSTITMVLTDRRGKIRERQMTLLAATEGGLDLSLIFFEAPADVKGVGMLSREQESGETAQWLYMPALGRSRRIAPSSRDDSFMGSDFSYEDLETRRADRDEHRFLREEVLDGVICQVVESSPKEESSYSRRVCWVDRETWIVRRVDFYDKKGNLQKRLTAGNLVRQEGVWMALLMTMEDVQRNQKTQLIWNKMTLNGGMDPELFTVGTLEGGLR